MEPTSTDSSPAGDRAGRPAPATSRLSRIGFADPAAALAALTEPRLAIWDPARDAPADDEAAIVLSAISRTADPDQALAALAGLAITSEGGRLVAALRATAAFRIRLLNLLGASRALADHLLVHPADALQLYGPEDQLPTVAGARGRLLAAVGADADDPVTGSGGTAASLTGSAAISALRAAYRRELVAVAARDLAGEWDLQQVTEALADLAGYLLSAGLAVARAGLDTAAPCRLAIIAMGKAGARELNYVSDVDVVFVASGLDGDDDRAEEAALATATRLASATIQICGQVAWEVDAALRPEGK
ncbi:MAG TPA: DUF294 nucleotidyltransferase-like domain-containing protein, partial [Jatrophihabitans sp.]